MDISKLSAIASTLIKNTKSAVELGSALVSENSIPTAETQKESQLMESALSSVFNSKQEVDAKKMMSAALLIAKKTGVLPVGVSESISGISSACLADEAVSRMKVAYKVATGEIDAYEASDKLVDQATARLVTVSDTAVKVGVDLAINKLGTWVAAAYPPALPVVTVIKTVQPYITAKAQHFVKKGIEKLNVVAKKAVRKTIDFVKTKVSNTVQRLLYLP